MSRTLRLRREPLTELAADDLAVVAGGMPITHVCNSLDFCELTPVGILSIAIRECLGTL